MQRNFYAALNALLNKVRIKVKTLKLFSNKIRNNQIIISWASSIVIYLITYQVQFHLRITVTCYLYIKVLKQSQWDFILKAIPTFKLSMYILKSFCSFYYKYSTAILCNVFVSFFLWQAIVSIEKNIVTEISVLLYISLLVTHIYHISTAKPHVLLNNMEKVRQLKARLQIMVYIYEREKIARRLHY